MFKQITDSYNYSFNIAQSGLYSIVLSATCKRRNYLRVEADNVPLKGITSKKNSRSHYNVPPAWNGSELKGTVKTVILVLKLSIGTHNLKFISKGEAEIIEEPKITLLNQEGFIALLKDFSSTEKDRQPWLTIVFIDSPLKILDIAVICQKRFLDSDDVKLIIDGQIQKNPQSDWMGKNWFWQGRKMRGQIQENRFYPNLSSGVHFVELWADRKPILKSVSIFLEKKEDDKRIPTADNPEWTGNFYDDSEAIILARLIFGEANNQPREAKVWVGWSVINRIKAKSWWPNNIHDVILQTGQYDPFKSSDFNFSKIINPIGFVGQSEMDKKSWFECYEIAEKIVLGKMDNPTEATHFHGIGVTRDWFEKQVVPKGRFLKKIGDTYFYYSSN